MAFVHYYFKRRKFRDILLKEDTIMYKKMLCCLLAFALVLVSGGDKLILSVGADLITDVGIGESETITTMPDFTDDTVLVVLTHEASLQFIDYTSADFPEVACSNIKDLTSGIGTKVQMKLRGEELVANSVGATFMNRNIDIDGFHRILSLKLQYPGKGNVLRAIVALEQREDVYSAEPNYIFKAIEQIEPLDPLAIVSPLERSPYGWAATKIMLEKAWGIENGDNSILVGVVDGGIDASHPELSGRVSESLSMSFSDDSIFATQDPHGHGTHVAGIIGAKYNNDSLNFSGVCQYVTLVSLRVFNTSGDTTVEWLTNAITYAAGCDIPVLNISMRVVTNELNALNKAIEDYPGIMICASGNDGLDTDSHDGVVPARLGYDKIVSVAASTSSDTRRWDSNFGKQSVDLFAPGEGILSCYPLNLCESGNCFHSGDERNGYHALSGTSQATPFVTGVVALILALHPNLTHTQLKNALLYSVDNVSAFSNECVSGGRLNAYRALRSTSAHSGIFYTSVNSNQHRVQCATCNLNILEDHITHPTLGVCTLCGE